MNPGTNPGVDAEILALLLRDANIPRRYDFLMLETCRRHEGWAKAFDRLRVNVDSRAAGNVVVLCGARGTGKTQMACELIRFLAVGHRFFCRYEVFQDYLDYLRIPGASMDNERYSHPRLLVIDEIAKSGDSAWAEQRLFHLVNVRYNDLKHTILITAAGPDQLSDILSPSVADRVNEGGAVIHLNWPSFRNNNP